ncbi:MAG: hypothetical protein IT330_18445 [Anaerolineae bacterium]|nr:hypothetical protein [Anaerolineae bacterium]
MSRSAGDVAAPTMARSHYRDALLRIVLVMRENPQEKRASCAFCWRPLTPVDADNGRVLYCRCGHTH